MQGGAAEDLVRLRKVGEAIDACNKETPSKRKKDDLVAPPIDRMKVEDEIVIAPQADAVLQHAREMFALSIAMPIAWLHFDADVESCRKRKHERVKEGVESVLRLQSLCRSKLLDTYFSFWSFFAEEEFYLLSLPILFWSVDYRFARHMNYVVCFGLLWGNLLKDVFRLPRPKNIDPKVWVPHNAIAYDNTACRDFGFPSTHAMNSVSNSLFAVLYCLEHYRAESGASFKGALLGSMLVWICSLSFGRLYLGVHSPMDVKGGLLLGTAIAMIAQWPLCVCRHFDSLVLATPHIGVVLLSYIVLVLVLNPQPRPMTPTFMQNCVVCGLIFGCAVGFRMETDRRQGADVFRRGSNQIGIGLNVLRIILGYAIVILVRAVLKTLLVFLFRLLGFEPSPAKPVPRSTEAMQAKQQEIKGWDLWAAAVIKTTVYAGLAWTILCGAPLVFELIGLPCAMNG
eukprot:TRINITY_DN108814_c0_g1_i1.p1 TRINITY_DN108814_c0_g1~~TRINITY_DN108814_c0_g1_i1.p1  ORF type:complete len:471 (-),score=75.56 TRINITY_DN108814_c0_g1_i1:74-1438(-)